MHAPAYRRPTLPALLLAAAGLLVSVCAYAAPEKPGEDKARELVERIDASRALLQKGQDAEAEAEIAKLFAQEPDPVERHLSVAMNLVRLAFEFREKLDLPAARRVAGAAMRRLRAAEELSAKDPQRLAEISSIRGTLHLHLIGDSNSAKAEFRKALAHDPANVVAKGHLPETKQGRAP